MTRLLAVLTLASLALAGCIQPPGDVETPSAQPRTGGTMTAKEDTKTEAGLCKDVTATSRFCATRVVKVDGTITSFSGLDVELATFNGDVTVSESKGDAWGFVATLKARGATADEATRNLDAIDFRWAHVEGAGHFLEVVAKHEGRAEHRSAEIALTMPSAVALMLVAATSNGDITVDGGRNTALSLATSNGEIDVTTQASQVNLATSNGDVDATITPLSDARWTVATSNGEITLKVPEDAKYGYQMEGTTSNGEVDYTLRDGEEGPCPAGSQYYTPPCNHRTFTSSGFSGRDVQLRVTLATSNGDITVSPK